MNLVWRVCATIDNFSNSASINVAIAISKLFLVFIQYTILLTVAYGYHNDASFSIYKMYVRFLVDKVFSDFSRGADARSRTFRTVVNFDDYYAVRRALSLNRTDCNYTRSELT